MSHPWMIVVGSAMVGWLPVELFAVFGRPVAIGMNFMRAAAGALIAGGSAGVMPGVRLRGLPAQEI